MSNGSNGVESLVFRRTLGVLACLVAAVTGAREMPAQFVSAIDLASRSAQPGAGEWQSQLTLSPFARFDSRRLSLEGRWTAVRTEGDQLNGFGNLAATYFSPTRHGLQLSIAGSAERAMLNETFGVTAVGTDTRLSYRKGRSGAWLGREFLRDNRPTPVSPSADVAAGAWHQWGNAVMTVSLSSFASREGRRGRSIRNVIQPILNNGPQNAPSPDTLRNTLDTLTFGDSGSVGQQRNWSDAEVALHWGVGPLALRGVIGRRVFTVNQPNETWGQLQGSVAFAPDVALIAATGVHPSSAVYGIARGRFMELGFRVSPSVLRKPRLPAGVRPAAAAFAIEDGARGQRTLRVRIPSARSVELSGDFTDWKPITLTRGDDDHWETTLPIPPGIHRLAIRVDGEAWTPPPGVSAVADEFQGVVGVIVVR